MCYLNYCHDYLSNVIVMDHKYATVNNRPISTITRIIIYNFY